MRLVGKRNFRVDRSEEKQSLCNGQFAGGCMNNSALDYALTYAYKNWYVFPVHGIKNGVCTCGKATCASPGKHPRTKNGLKDATTDEAAIRRWFEGKNNINIGIATGAISGLVVVDVDAKSGGLESLAKLNLGKALTVNTGGGGKHLYYQWPTDVSIGNSVGKLAPGIDIRGIRGYVVAPPSLHVSGKSYEWEASNE
jgi:hypothetical protein